MLLLLHISKAAKNQSKTKSLTVPFSLAIAQRLSFLIVASIKMQSSYRVIKANKRRRHKGYIQRKFAGTRSILPLVLPGYSK